MFFRKVLIPLFCWSLSSGSLAQDQSQPSSTQPSTSKPDPPSPSFEPTMPARTFRHQRRSRRSARPAPDDSKVKHDGSKNAWIHCNRKVRRAVVWAPGINFHA